MSLSRQPAALLPGQPFFATPAQRIGLARQRFFEEGQRPSGLVDEAVIQSWTRCLQARRQPSDQVDFEPVSASRLHSVLGRNRRLLQAAASTLRQLDALLAGTGCRVLLADADGVVVHATSAPPAAHEQLLPAGARLGIDLSEKAVGTTAPGIVLKSQRASVVLGAEHFFSVASPLFCAAAPVHDHHGRLAAVLDLSIEGRGFGFDAAAVAGLYATAIENRLLQTSTGEQQLLLRFQACPSLLGTPLEGLAGVDARGLVSWINPAGAGLLGCAARPTAWAGSCDSPTEATPVDTLFGLDLNQLLARTQRPAPGPVALPNGLTVWLQSQVGAWSGAQDDGSAPPLPRPACPPAEPGTPSGTSDTCGTSGDNEAQTGLAEPMAPSPPTLGDHTHQHISHTLQACGGNISRAARLLGVSRGLLYRHLQRHPLPAACQLPRPGLRSRPA